jgi:hypothetical protein
MLTTGKKPRQPTSAHANDGAFISPFSTLCSVVSIFALLFGIHDLSHRKLEKKNHIVGATGRCTVYRLGGILGSVDHRVKIHNITPATGKERGDVEIRDYVVFQKPRDLTDCLPPPLRPSPFFNPVANKHTIDPFFYNQTFRLGVSPSTSDKFHYRHAAFFSQLKSKFECRRHTFTVTISHSPITLRNLSSINLVSIFRCSSPPRNPVYTRRVDPSDLPVSLSSHRHSYTSLLFTLRLIINTEVVCHDRQLNEDDTDKIRAYLTDYNNRPSRLIPRSW